MAVPPQARMDCRLSSSVREFDCFGDFFLELALKIIGTVSRWRKFSFQSLSLHSESFIPETNGGAGSCLSSR